MNRKPWGSWIALPMLAHLAEAELGLGNIAAAHCSADEAVVRLRQHELRWRETRALLARARVLLTTEGAKAAERIQTDLDDALTPVRAWHTPVGTAAPGGTSTALRPWWGVGAGCTAAAHGA